MTPLQELLDNHIGQIFGVEEDRTRDTVVWWGMMLREVVDVIVPYWFPVHVELSLFGAILQPVVTHVDGFGSFLLDSVVCKHVAHGVVYL